MNIIFHIDVNNAFLSWTAVDLLQNGSKYDIRNSYAVIGGDETARRGIVVAKSTPCKKLGIYTSETLFSAKKKCPALRVFTPNYKLYSKMSNDLFNLISQYTNDIEIASIDECYLDYGKIKNLYGDEMEFAKKLQEEIKEKLKFTVNIGIANNKLCAKMASDFSKPFKIHTLYDYEIKEKLYPLKVGELHGIGTKTSIRLNELNINTIEDLAKASEELLYKNFKNRGQYYKNIANGIDDSKLEIERELDSISSETTLQNDIKEKMQVYNELLKISTIIGARIRKEKKYAYVVCIILKDNFFKRKTHQKKIINPVNSDEEIFKLAKQIYDEMNNQSPIRLIGIKLDKLTDKKIYQPNLFEQEEKTEIDDVLDNLKNKFGTKVISKASLKDFKNKKE